MSENQHLVKKRKKYLEPDATGQKAIVPRTSVWRGQSSIVPNEVLNLAEETRHEEAENVIETVGQAFGDFSSDDEKDSLNVDDPCFDGEGMHSEDECAELHEDDEIYYDRTFRSDHLAENLKSFEKPLFPDSSSTTAETLLMIMVYAMKHKLSWTAVEDLLKLFNTIFGQSVLPETKHSFNKIFGTADSMSFHFYCNDCNNYLGKFEGQLTKEFNDPMVCPNVLCKKVHSGKTLKEGNFFATLSIRKQIAALLNMDAIRDSLSTSLEQINDNLYDMPNSVSDLTDGELYKKKRYV
nr:uncharacterized protein LOC122268791 [Parasteatoda tepidariorum]